jgi:hypothetical protein
LALSTGHRLRTCAIFCQIFKYKKVHDLFPDPRALGRGGPEELPVGLHRLERHRREAVRASRVEQSWSVFKQLRPPGPSATRPHVLPRLLNTDICVF